MVRVEEPTENDYTLGGEGEYRVEVVSCTEKTTKKGDTAFVAELIALDWNRQRLAYDWLMLEGAGRQIGMRKLRGMGFAKGTNVEAEDLVGWTGVVHAKVETYKGTDSLRVNTDANDDGGYAPEDTARKYTMPEEGADLPDAPW